MDQRNGTWKRAVRTHAMRELRLSILGERDGVGDGMKIVPYIFRLQTPCVSRIIVSVTKAPEWRKGNTKHVHVIAPVSNHCNDQQKNAQLWY